MLQAAVLLLLVSLSVFGGERSGDSAAYNRKHYAKYEYLIPMRDGVKLFTSVYVPKDTSQPCPILMERTPYSVRPYGVDNYRKVLGPSRLFAEEGFIFVYQDVRGRYMSEGTFVDVPFHKPQLDGPRDTDESTDTYDTIDWLLKNIPDNNGKAGLWGISYPGFFAAFGLIDSHPALKAVSAQAPMADVGNGDDSYHNGAFFLAANFDFYTEFGPRQGGPAPRDHSDSFHFGTKDQYAFYLRMGPLENANALYFKNRNPFWDDLMQHPTYDRFWQSRALAQYMKHVKPATLFVGGWFDAEDLAGPLKLFRAVEANGPSAPDTLVMGPWPHGGWSHGDGDALGDLEFGSKTGPFFREEMELRFFLKYLKGKSGEDLPKAWAFETGRNEWRRFDSWPPKSAVERTIFLDAGGLTFRGPPAPGADEYVSDPARPVPVIASLGEGMPSDYMTYDQRFASQRPDVLVYETPPLDGDLVVAGPVTPALKVSTTGTDSDFIVKLIDVYPNGYPSANAKKAQMGGYEQLVRGEPFRGKFRNSLETPEPFTPGEPAKIEFAMPDVFHAFRTGHRIMVQIQSSWFPLIDRNPQQFLNIPTAKAADFRKATERVYRGGADGSRIRVWVLDER